MITISVLIATIFIWTWHDIFILLLFSCKFILKNTEEISTKIFPDGIVWTIFIKMLIDISDNEPDQKTNATMSIRFCSCLVFWYLGQRCPKPEFCENYLYSDIVRYTVLARKPFAHCLFISIWDIYKILLQSHISFKKYKPMSHWCINKCK